MYLKLIQHEGEGLQVPFVAAGRNRQRFRIVTKKLHRDLQSLKLTDNPAPIVAAAAVAVEADSQCWLIEVTGGPLNPLCSWCL